MSGLVMYIVCGNKEQRQGNMKKTNPEIKLKHTWSEKQAAVIIKLLETFPGPDDTRCIETRLMVDLMMFFRQISGKDMQFFQLWELLSGNSEFTADIGNPSVRRWDGYYTHWWITAFCQGATAVFTGSDPLENFSKYDAVFDFFLSGSSGKVDVKLPRLPERLKEKAFLSAIADRDGAKIALLYDLCLNPGEKMKNIFNILLNKRDYSTLMFLHSRYGLLENYSPEVILPHFITASPDPGKAAFDRFFTDKGFSVGEAEWNKYGINNPLGSTISSFLQKEGCGEWPLLANASFSVSQRVCRSFVDEFAEPLKSWDAEAQKNINMYDWQIRRLYEHCQAAEVFFKLSQANSKESRQ